MRIAKSCFPVLLVVLIFICIPVLAGKKFNTVTKPAPKLRAIIMYEWALNTGGTKVNFDTRQLESFTRNIKINQEEAEAIRSNVRSGYPIFYIHADLINSDIATIEKLINNSNLRYFQPKLSDVKHRQPYLDECPPTLVIIWTDKKKVFELPLTNTIRKNTPKTRSLAYQNMENLCDSLRRLNYAYSKKPYISAVSTKSRKYKAFEEERDHLIK